MIVTNNIIKELNTDDGHIGEIRYSREIMKCNDRAHATIEILKKMNANNIVHVGCCNHVLEIDRLIESQRHLHLLLQEHFDKVVGFDINEAAIAYFNEKTHRGVYIIMI